jgi:hypothetical protein
VSIAQLAITPARVTKDKSTFSRPLLMVIIIRQLEFHSVDSCDGIDLLFAIVSYELSFLLQINLLRDPSGAAILTVRRQLTQANSSLTKSACGAGVLFIGLTSASA